MAVAQELSAKYVDIASNLRFRYQIIGQNHAEQRHQCVVVVAVKIDFDIEVVVVAAAAAEQRLKTAVSVASHHNFVEAVAAAVDVAEALQTSSDSLAVLANVHRFVSTLVAA